MTRKPREPIMVGEWAISRCPPLPEDHVRVTDGWDHIDIPLTSAPAVAAGILTLAREMGADVPDPDAVIRALADALDHMQLCRSCAEGSWNGCEGGRDAQATLAAARAYLEGRG